MGIIWPEPGKPYDPWLAAYRCPICFQDFSLRVWHCPGCDHHLNPEVLTTCKYCGKFSIDDDGRAIYEEDAKVVAMTREEFDAWDEEQEDEVLSDSDEEE
jgi:hypothetical protein